MRPLARRSAALAMGAALAAAGLAGCSDEPPADPAAAGLLALCQRKDDGNDVDVTDAASLTTALAQARPGQRIHPEPGVYQGPFEASAVGTEATPIALCGSSEVELIGRKSSYALHLEGASWWSVQGLTVRDAQKGVVLDRTTHSSLVDLKVSDVGQEAVHLRANSTDNTVAGLRIQSTGQTDPEYGEGVYIGSAASNWCRYTDCAPDASDRNSVLRTTFGPGITAENIDIKEGTTGGIVEGNTLSGKGATEADSWVDVKGNAWVIRGNTGSDAAKDGMQVHVESPGWGTGNAFSANTLQVDAPGFGVFVAKDATGNVVACNNSASGAGSGLTNVTCTP